jgi:DNA polymerase-3 subunit alpha
MRIPVLLPDVNRSGADFSIDKDKDGRAAIRFGLAAVKNVGESAVHPLLEAVGKGGPFKSIEDYCRRGAIEGSNRRILESLIKAGALDSLGNRGTLLASIDRIVNLAQQEAKLRDSGQSSMFNVFGEQVPIPMEQLSLQGAEALPKEKVAWEKELLGVPLSENPMSVLASKNNVEAIASRDQIDAEMDGQRISIVGQLSSTVERMTRKGETFAVGTLELLGGSIEVLAWPNTYQQIRNMWSEGAFLWIVGRVRDREGTISITCDEVKPFNVEQEVSQSNNHHNKVQSAPPTTSQKILVVCLQETGRSQEDAGLVHDVLRTCLEYPGRDRLNMEIHTGRQKVLLDVPIVGTNCCPELQRRLETLVGVGRLRIANGPKNGDAQ